MPTYADQAPLGKRALALFIDCLCVYILYWSVVNADLPAVEEQFVALSVAVVLAGVTASTRVLPGQSPGKYLTRLLVLSADAEELPFFRQVARDSSIPLVAFLLSFGFIIAALPTLEQGFGAALACLAVADLLCASLRIDNRSMADVVFRTRVVRLPPLQPHRAPAGPMYSATDAEFGKSGQAPKGDALYRASSECKA